MNHLKVNIKPKKFATISILILFTISFAFIPIFEKTFIYPLRYKEEVFEFSAEFDLPPTLIFAIIKVESSFDKTSESDVGAKGLMQITDKTGAYIASLLSIEYYDLFDAKTNVKFGCFYIKYLIDRFYFIDTVICAYNAGEGNVASWLKNPQYSTDKKTLNHIPFYETRQYLKKIKKSFSKYQKLYRNILDK